jgi:hypothetical protein
MARAGEGCAGIVTRTAAAIVALAATVGLAACGPAAPGPPPSTATDGALPGGVEIELFQLRSDVAERGAQVRIVNDSDDDLVVTKLTFDDDWFAGEAVRDRTSMISAGRTVDLHFGLPEVACEGEADAAARTSRVIVEFSVDDVARTATVDVADPLGFTAVIHEKECLRHDLAQVATLEWTSFAGSASPLPAQMQLSITPAGGDGAATLIEVQTTNLLQFGELPTPFPLNTELSGAAAATLVDVPLLPLRCDPHAVMEDKRGTVFNVMVSVDGATGVVEVAASEKLRGEILRWVADWCGFGPG